MAPRILAGPVNVEFVVGMLDRRHHETPCHEVRNDRGQQRRLAAAAPAGETENAHPSPHLGGVAIRRKLSGQLTSGGSSRLLVRRGSASSRGEPAPGGTCATGRGGDNRSR